MRGHEAMPRWPMSAPPTSSTRRFALDLLPEPDGRCCGELLLLRGQAQTSRAATPRGRRCWPKSSLPGALAHGPAGRRGAEPGGFGLSPGIVDDDLVAVLEEALDGLRPRQRVARAPARAPGRRLLLLRCSAAPRGARAGGARHRARLDDPPTLAYVLDQGHIATNGPDTAERGLAWAP